MADPSLNTRRPYVDEDSSSDQKFDINEKTEVQHEVHDLNIEKLHELADQLGDTQRGLAPTDDIEMVMDKIDVLTVEESRQIIQQLLIDHKWDYNFSMVTRAKLEKLLLGPGDELSQADWEFELKSEAAVNKFYSPYPEVRAVATPNDDPTIPCETIRAHLLGYIWAIIGQFVNSFFNSRFPNIYFQSPVAQILLYPCGKILAFILPDWGVTIMGTRHSLNPGPWTYKEQMLSTIIFNVSITSAYVFWNIQTQTVYYKDTWLTPGYEILLLLSTQLMGLGFAGLLRRFVIYPIETFWPSVLPTLALNRALLVPEKRETIHGWSLSRYQFFFIFFGAMFVYFWLPGWCFPALSYFAWMTWISPDNFNLNMITGSQLGLGFNPISSFDWNIFGTSVIYPLTFPFYASAQMYSGQLIAGMAIIGIYYSNTLWTSYMPINSPGIFDNTGASYNISRVIVDGILDEDAYQNYSPAFYTAGNLVLYGAFFAFYPFTFVFILLDAWRPITRAYRKMAVAAYSTIKSMFVNSARGFGSLFRGRLREAGFHFSNFNGEGSVYDGFDDPFTNLMRNYAEVPDWWFFLVALIAFIFSIILLTKYNLNTPVWTIFFVIGINLAFLIPMTYLYAISGVTEGLNVVTELIVGYALPGNPEALMFVKAFGYNINGQADNYISDQKMGFYSKVPPRAMFRGQIVSSIVACFICYAVVNFIDNNIVGICTPDQAQRFSCANGSQVYFSSSVVWGLIGPKRIFNQIYPIMKYAFLIGFLLALVWWTVKRVGTQVHGVLKRSMPAAVFRPLDLILFTPFSWLRNVHPSLLFNGMLFWAPLNLTYTTSSMYFSFFFMYYLKRYKTAWWEKYNYVLSAAFAGAIAFSGIIIFFAVQYHPVTPNWWGVNILGGTLDGGGASGVITRLQLGVNETFGPATWY